MKTFFILSALPFSLVLISTAEMMAFPIAMSSPFPVRIATSSPLRKFSSLMIPGMERIRPWVMLSIAESKMKHLGM